MKVALPSGGCVYYPTNASTPLAAVTMVDGFAGAGGCGAAQTSDWGPFYASHGIVTMIVATEGADQPQQRALALQNGLAELQQEDTSPSSPLYGRLAGRYGTAGFSMGGGGATLAAQADPSLFTSVAQMPWNPVGDGVTVPTLFICGDADTLANCDTHAGAAYTQMPTSTPRALVTIASGHSGQPTAGGGDAARWALAFQKVYLEGDERWEPLLQPIAGDL